MELGFGKVYKVWSPVYNRMKVRTFQRELDCPVSGTTERLESHKRRLAHSANHLRLSVMRRPGKA